MFRLLRVLLLCGVASALLAPAARGTTLPPGTVTLAWDPSPSPTVVGYKVYQGVASLNYTNVIDVGTSTKVTITGLTAGVTYYFAVTAYDTNQLESPLSGEITYTVPSATATLTTLKMSLSPTKQVVLTGTGPAGYGYDLQVTKDLATWTRLVSVTNSASGTFQYTDAASVTNKVRLYRLRQTSP